MKKYKIPIDWCSYRNIEVEADNLEDACVIALKQFLSEPDDDYLDDSFQINNQMLNEYHPGETYDYLNVWNRI